MSQKSYSKMLASTIQFTTNPPTPTQNPQQPGAPDRSGNQGALPQNPDSMPPPHAPSTRGHPPHPTTHTSRKQKHDRRVFYTKHQATQPPRTPVHDGQPPGLPRRAAPAGPDPYSGPDNKRPGSHPHTTSILRKEVIQPHLPVRLPCYDFVPITSPTFDRSP